MRGVVIAVAGLLPMAWGQDTCIAMYENCFPESDTCCEDDGVPAGCVYDGFRYACRSCITAGPRNECNDIPGCEWDDSLSYGYGACINSSDLGRRPSIGDCVRVYHMGTPNDGKEARIVEDDGSDLPFQLDLDCETNSDWFAENHVTLDTLDACRDSCPSANYDCAGVQDGPGVVLENESCCASGVVDDCGDCDGSNKCMDCDGTAWGPGKMFDGKCCASGHVDQRGCCYVDGDYDCPAAAIDTLAKLQAWCDESYENCELTCKGSYYKSNTESTCITKPTVIAKCRKFKGNDVCDRIEGCYSVVNKKGKKKCKGKKHGLA